jgi:hypothetical protein
MESLFTASSTGQGVVVAYEGLVVSKAQTVKQIASYLEIPVTAKIISRIEEETSVENMRTRAASTGNEGHFRTEVERQPRSMITDQHIEMVNNLISRDTPSLSGLVQGSGLAWLLQPLGRD